ncbi:MAG: GP88 family protein [Rhodospirillales bacterium]|jgi:hypothetical protein
MTTFEKSNQSIKYAQAKQIIGSLSRPSKMPWFSYSLPTSACKLGSRLQNVSGSICSVCYARGGLFRMDHVKRAAARRLQAISDPQWMDAFVVVLNHEFRRRRRNGPENRFRWHDGGDIQSVEHLRNINQIALSTPSIRHALFTKEREFVAEFLKESAFAPNLFVRISNSMRGGTYRTRPEGLPFSTVGRDTDPTLFQCPAYRENDNKCGSCDMCWTGNVSINFPEHLAPGMRSTFLPKAV